MRTTVLALGLAMAGVVFGPTEVRATVIEYEAVDIVDVTPGQDLWIYRYYVSEFTFLAGQGFTILFDEALFRDLQDPPDSVGGDWDILTLQPDLATQSGGMYDALALGSPASLGTPFRLSFVWLGGSGASPGSQAFTINEFDAAGALTVLEIGETVARGQPAASVPEPSTLWLMAVAAALARPWRAGRRPR
jgi:hypothetical protein